VRCHGDIVRALRNEENVSLDDIVGKMAKICRVLDANVLTILVPDQSGISSANLANGLSHISTKFDIEKTRLAVEVRGGATKEALAAMTDNNIVHCVDVSREQPAVKSGILYSRLFGKGQDNIYQFDDEEIRDIARKAVSPKFERSILAFHGVRMYSDAARLKAFLQTGKFLQVTGQTGLDSLGAVLKEDTEFPSSKQQLIARQGWKLFDLTVEKRIRAEKVLSNLPSRIYKSHEELMGALDPFFRAESTDLHSS
jgi:hypothetical protein